MTTRRLKPWLGWFAAILGMAALASAGWRAFGRDLAHYAGPAESRLSQTGLYADIAARRLARGVVPFEPRFQLWSDGAVKRRYIYLPPGTRIDTRNPDRWNFPEGTRLWKEFERDGVVVETRMLLKTGPGPGDWDMAVYLWREDGTDADKLAFARTDARGTPHDVPSPRMCTECHGSGNERRTLGFTQVQLPWARPGFVSLRSLGAAGLLSEAPAAETLLPGDAATRAALGYLHANCGSCHYQGSTRVPGRIPLRLALAARPVRDPGQTDAYLSAVGRPPLVAGLESQVYVAPGNPHASLLWRRMGERGNAWHMPPLASELADRQGMALVRTWIESLDDENAGVAPRRE